MSLDAYNRNTQRESLTWRPFAFSFPFNSNQTTDRIIIYGLYSNSYLNQQQYLVAVEAVELTNLLNDYNIKIAGLTTDQQVVVADIVSKRYLAGIDKLIHDQKMVTKQSEIDAENLIWDAKIAAPCQTGNRRRIADKQPGPGADRLGKPLLPRPLFRLEFQGEQGSGR